MAEQPGELWVARWKGGRPRTPDARRRRLSLPAVRLTDDEMREVAGSAARCGLSLSELVRRRLLGRRLPLAVPLLNRDAWVRLGPLAANLNQYVRAIHQGKCSQRWR